MRFLKFFYDTLNHSIARNSKLYYNLYADRKLCCIIAGSELTFKWRIPPSAVMPSKIIRWFFFFYKIGAIAPHGHG